MADRKREDVIKGLECCNQGERCRECPYAKTSYDPEQCIRGYLLFDALSLLKAQEPVEPDVDVDTWICGKCGHTLEHQELVGNNILFHEQYSYCPNCGKRVKWNADD